MSQGGIHRRNVHLGNIVNNIMTTLMVKNSNWTYCGDHFIMYKNVESLCHIPETNIILYVNSNNKKAI